MTGPDDDFLRVAIQAIERIRERSVERGHLMLGSLLDMAKSQAEDELRSNAKPKPRGSEAEANGTHLDDQLEAELRREITGLRRD